MKETNFILSLCGTSLLTSDVAPELRSIINKYSNAVNEENVRDASLKDHQLLHEHLKETEKKIYQADIELAKKYSAELNGVLSFYNESTSRYRNDFHELLCTDTWLGQKAAEFVKGWLEGQGFTVHIHSQKDLRTEDVSFFWHALSELVQWCHEEVDHWRKSYHVVFNLTGGFKSIQGFLQILAQFYADETVYIFETGKELLRMPRLPIKMAAQDIVQNNLSIFRSLDLKLEVSQEQLRSIPETMLIQINGQTSLSAWGGLVWNQTKKDLYSTEIFPPPSDLLKFGPGFMQSVANLPPDRKALVNERIDDLVKHLKEHFDGHGSPYNPSSLSFKQLKSKPLPPSTHECNAWSDKDARRLFGHFEGHVFILDKLDKGLH